MEMELTRQWEFQYSHQTKKDLKTKAIKKNKEGYYILVKDKYEKSI